jgi:hypothetical protein
VTGKRVAKPGAKRPSCGSFAAERFQRTGRVRQDGPLALGHPLCRARTCCRKGNLPHERLVRSHLLTVTKAATLRVYDSRSEVDAALVGRRVEVVFAAYDQAKGNARIASHSPSLGRAGDRPRPNAMATGRDAPD